MTNAKSARLSIVIPAAVAERLREVAEREGRSQSNLAASLIRTALRDGRPESQ